MTFPVHLLIAQPVTASATGSTAKVVECEQCGKAYCYPITRTAVGGGENYFFVFGDGEANAKARAEANVAKALAKGCEPVACPACGWYQKHMYRRARQLRNEKLANGSVALFVSSLLTGGLAFVALVNEFPVVAGILGGIAGLGLILVPAVLLLKFGLSFHYDPNYDFDKPSGPMGTLVTLAPAPVLKSDGQRLSTPGADSR